MVIDYKTILKSLVFQVEKTPKENIMMYKLTEWDNQNFKKQCEEVWNI